MRRPCVGSLTGRLTAKPLREPTFLLSSFLTILLEPLPPLATFLPIAILKKGSFLAQPLRDWSIPSSIEIIVLLQRHLAYIPLDFLDLFLLGKPQFYFL
jgi:hypothetical protein